MAHNQPAPAGVVNMRGREYLTVALRIALFRQDHPISAGWCLATQPVSIDDSSVLFRAAIIDPSGVEVAVGYAEEKRTARGVNSTSAVENCETSAIGRALSAAGWLAEDLGIQPDPQVQPQPTIPADRREAVALERQWREEAKVFIGRLKVLGLGYDPVADYCEAVGWPRPSAVDSERRDQLFHWLKMKGGTEKVLAWAASQDPGDTPNDAQPDPAGEAS